MGWKIDEVGCVALKVLSAAKILCNRQFGRSLVGANFTFRAQYTETKGNFSAWARVQYVRLLLVGALLTLALRMKIDTRILYSVHT